MLNKQSLMNFWSSPLESKGDTVKLRNRRIQMFRVCTHKWDTQHKNDQVRHISAHFCLHNSCTHIVLIHRWDDRRMTIICSDLPFPHNIKFLSLIPAQSLITWTSVTCNLYMLKYMPEKQSVLEDKKKWNIFHFTWYAAPVIKHSHCLKHEFNV